SYVIERPVLVPVGARNRTEVFESLSRQCAELEGVRVVMDRRESTAAASPATERRLRSITLDLEALGFAIVPAARPAVPRAGKAAPAPLAVLRLLEGFGAFSAAPTARLAAPVAWRARP